MTDYSSSVPQRLSWRSSALVRVAGSAVSWFLFALCFTLLFLSSTAVIGLGGFCASGGPYVIAVQCPDSVVAFTPLSIIGGLIAVALWMFLAQGFGTPLTTWAWPILFCGLGVAFLTSFVQYQEPTGLIVGVLFELMGIAPLIIEVRGSVQRVLIGQFSATGAQFYEGERARRSMMSPKAPNPDGSIKATAGSWALALGVLLVAIVAGIFAARALFGV